MTQSENQQSLIEDVNQKRREIRTDGYAMSISEWVSLYESEEIDIHPEFQRFYRWSEKQKTDLIESILLGIPIPPVFVSQRPDGIWDVVDGLQRLSTIYQFMGILKDESGNLFSPLVLTSTKYLPSLKGKKWGDPDDPENSLSQELRLIIKRSKINVSIILKESDKDAKYDLFQRLNTGGSSLSPQEIRNCILVMLNKDFFLWLQDLSKYQPFQESISLSDRPLDEAYDMELALRFIVFSLIDEEDLSSIGDVGEFITEKMSIISTDENFDKQSFESLFKQTFDLLNQELGDRSFKRFYSAKDKFMGGFLVSQYEVVAYGLAYALNDGHVVTNIREKVASIWSNPEFTNWSGAGITATRRLPRIIPLGRELFSNND
jgi:uncharacterized protein with ParB-like and HNH nuclease domain